MSNENNNDELVPGLSVTKPELEMLRNKPEAFERYIKFYEMKLKVQTERALAKTRAEMEEREKIRQKEFEEREAVRQKEFEEREAVRQKELSKYELSLKMEEQRLEIESKEREDIRIRNNEFWEYLLDAGVNCFTTLKSNNNNISEDVLKSIDESNLDLG